MRDIIANTALSLADSIFARPPQFANIVEGTDAPGNTTTTYSITAGDTFTGSLAAGFGEADWVAISLTAGESVEFALTGAGGSPIANPYLQLYDSTGSYITFDNNGGPGLDALIVFTAPTTGTYYISAEEFSFGAGDYELTVTAAPTLPVYTLDQIAFQLTDEYWTNQGDIRAGFNATAGDTITVNITALTPEGQQLARWALEAWTEISGLIFQEVAGAAQITFDDEAGGAYANSSLSGGYIASSTVNVSKNDWLPTYGTTIDSYSFQTYMHEIGHALGLGHAGHYNGAATYGIDNHYLNDSWQATVMSYFNQTENSYIIASYAYTVTLMPADIIAIQDLYGGTVSSNPGNTTYGEGANTGTYLDDLLGQFFGEDPADPTIFAGNAFAFTIADTGGTDTIDFSGSTDNNVIDLTPEAISDVLGLTGNMQIARGTIIENVTTGSGDDTITGNSADNIISGGAGTDVITGEAGSDELSGGSGNDTLTGGSEDDLLLGNTGSDTLDGGDDADRLFGGPDADILQGGEGDDKLFGSDGDDTLDGGNGTNKVYGGDGADELTAGTGYDIFFGEVGIDTFIFGDDWGRDRIKDFENGSEQVDMTAVTGLASYSDLKVGETLTGHGYVKYGNDFIVFIGVPQSDLDSSDFLI